ncbi:hypothetical protein EJD97_002378 [Solanum chilense]|uniref:FBD domain-containing protein n=1 Tax=Solanum chilense TaxID=4083 RepID=A0A6N2BYZ0_SOLCI|nr:hypothetical protein EJD97_002378 [Solanum chilense]
MAKSRRMQPEMKAALQLFQFSGGDDNSNNQDQVKYQLSFPPLLNALNVFTYLSFEVAWAQCLLRSSPYLEELEIKGPGDLSGELLDWVPWDTVDEILASFPDVTYNYLRAVKITGEMGAGVDMQLIKVLLAKSPVLLRMVIHPNVEGDDSLEDNKISAGITASRSYI